MRTKSLKRRISNILLLGILLAIVVGIYYNIFNSKAESVLEVPAIAIDNYGYLGNEIFDLEAKLVKGELYEIELPDTVNNKKILEIIAVTLEEIQEDDKTENIQGENAEEKLETENVIAENNKADNQKTENVKTVEIKDNKIQLTKKEIESNKIAMEVKYDVAIIEKNEEGTHNKSILSEKTEEERKNIEIKEETEVVYNQTLRYEDKENGKLVEVKGLLPAGAQLNVRQLSQEQLEAMFEGGKVSVAYDIKIVINTLKLELVDKQDESKGLKETFETIEVNPEDFGEKCEVSIKDIEILENSYVYHVKEDKTLEKVEVTNTVNESVSFEAQSFSIYAVSQDDGIMLAYDDGDGFNVTFTPKSSDWTKSSITVVMDSIQDDDNIVRLWVYKYGTIVNDYDLNDNTISHILTGTGKWELKVRTNLGHEFHSGVYHIDQDPPTLGSWTFSGRKGNNGWYRPGTITAENGSDGVLQSGHRTTVVYWTNYNGNAHASGTSFEWKESGKTYNFRIITEDNALNHVEGSQTSIKVDGRSPTKPTISVSPTAGWTNQDVTVTLSGGADNSGESGFYGYIYNDGDDITDANPDYENVSGSSVKFTTEGERTAYFKSLDNVYYWSSSVSTTIKIDKTKPKVKTATYKAVSSGITVTVTGEDALSGVTHYSYDDGSTWVTSNTHTYAEGTTTAKIKVKDAAGNISDTYSLTMDVTAPTISISPNSNTTWSKNGGATVTISDSGLGLATGAKIKYGWSTSLDSAPTYTGEQTITGYSAGAKTATFTPTGQGKSGKLYLWVQVVTLKDTADNSYAGTNPIKTTGQFYLDNTAPTKPTITNPSNGNWTNVTVTLSASTEDAHSKVKSIKYSYNQTSWTDMTVTLDGNVATASGDWSSQRDATVYIKAIDNADNESEVASTKVRIDKAKPTITVSPTTVDNTMTTSVTFTVAETGGSGLSTSNLYEYQIGSSNSSAPTGAWSTYATGSSYTIGSGLTGVKYLWVRRISDVAGNKSNTTEYHVFGPYKFNQFTVTYNYSENGGTSASNGGTAYPVNSGAAVDLTPTATKAGWEFVGWNTNKDATTKLTSYTMPQSNLTLYAIYKKTLTGRFYYYNNQYTDKTVTIYNKATTGNVTTPSIANATNGGATYTPRGWSKSTSANASSPIAQGATVTLTATTSANTIINYYASYHSDNVPVTIYYWNGSAQVTNTSLKGSRDMNYKGAFKHYDIENPVIPTAVTGSTGPASTTYSHVSTSLKGSAATVNTGNTYYAVYTRTVTLTFKGYNNKKEGTATGTAYGYSDGTTASPTIQYNGKPANVTANGYTYKGIMWSKDTAAQITNILGDYGTDIYNIVEVQGTSTKISVQELYDATYYGSYVRRYSTATVYYWNGSAQASYEIYAYEYMNYVGSTTQDPTYLITDNTSYHPRGEGKYATTYQGISASKNSVTLTENFTVSTGNKYYVVYTVGITFHYYDGTQNKTKSATRRWLSNGTTYAGSVSGEPSPQPYNGAEFEGWSSSSTVKNLVDPATTDYKTFYAYYNNTGQPIKFYYWNGSSQTSKTVTAQRELIFDENGNEVFSVTVTIPTEVTGSSGPQGTTYLHVSRTKDGNAITPTSEYDVYYAVYTKTVTLTKHWYNNQSSSESKTGYGYSDGTVTKPEFSLGTKSNITLGGYTFTPRWWSTETTATGAQSVAVNGTAEIMESDDYYLTYETTMEATFYYWNGTKQTTVKDQVKRWANYLGTTANERENWNIPSEVSSSSGKYSTVYKGVSASTNSETAATTPLPLTTTKYYAYYNVSVQFYYYTGTDTHTNEFKTRKWLTNGTTYSATIETVPTPNTYKNATFKGWSSTQTFPITAVATNSIATSNATTFYAYYTRSLTYYYYNGSSHTSKAADRTWLTTSSSFVSSVPEEPTPSAYDDAAFKGWSESSDEVVDVEPIDTDKEKVYAYYQKTVTVNFHYWGGSATKSATKTGTRTYISKSGGINQYDVDVTVPTAVSGSTGPTSTAYKYVSLETDDGNPDYDGVKAQATTITTAETDYYAIYEKTVTITKYTYNNVKSTITYTVYGYYNGNNDTPGETLADPGNVTVDGMVYSAKWWSTSTAADGAKAIDIGGKVEVLNNTTYYAVYHGTVTATFYYHTGGNTSTTQSSKTSSAQRLMNYKGTGKDVDIAIPTEVTGSSGQYGTEYKGVAGDPSSHTAKTPTTADTTYYAFYDCTITYHYYNGTSKTTTTTTRRSESNGSAYVCTVDSVPTTPAYKSAAFAWWSIQTNSINTTYKKEPNATEKTDLYAVYQKTVTPRYYYWNGSSQTYKDKAETLSYVANASGFDVIQNPTIPTEVTGSSGNYSTTYQGVSKDKNSATTITVDIDTYTTYYAVYTVPVTFYYYNGTSHTSATKTRRWLTNSGGTTYAATMDSVPSPSAFDGGTFKGWSKSSSEVQVAEPPTVSNTTLYAYYERTIPITYYYWGGSAQKSVVKNYTRKYISKNNAYTTINVTDISDIPSEVTSSSGPENTTYKFITDSLKGTSAVVPTTASNEPKYYAIYERTVTATRKYYNNQTSTSATGTAKGYSDGSTANAQITLANPHGGNITISGNVYVPRGWSTSSEPKVETIDVAVGAKASLLYDETYYLSYTSDIEATFYYWNGTKQTSVTTTAPGYMDFEGDQLQGSYDIPEVVRNSSGKYSTIYRGVSAETNSIVQATLTTTTTKYYAYYTVPITYWYYNGSNQVSSTADRHWLSNGTTYVGTVTAEPTTTSKYDNASFVGWSKSNTAIQAVEPEATDAVTLYAYYQKSVEATFHYWNGTAQTNAKASNTRTYISKSGGVTQVDTNLTIPTAVTGSSGKYATIYRGVSKDKNSTTTIATPKTDITTYYAVYTVPVTFYYYNGSSHTSKSETRQWLSNGTTYVNTITAVPTPSSYNSSTFKNWSTKANEVSSISPNEPKSVDATTLYAYYERTITATFHYWDRGSSSAKSTTNNNIRTYISKSGGVTTLNTNIVIPTVVTSSGGPEATSYVHVSETVKGQTAVTPTTTKDTPVYYAVYNKTVTATLMEYNDHVFGTPTGTAWGYYDGTTTNAEITLGTPSNQTISGNTYRPRWWSLETTPNAEQNVALNGKASILYDTTYYAPYESTITATFYYWNGTKQTSVTNTALGYMNYKGVLQANDFEIPAAVTGSSGKYSTEYAGISSNPNSIEPATVNTTTTVYYAYYIKQITYWYYNGTAQTSSTADRHWLSQGSSSTYQASVTAKPTTTSKYDNASFVGWSKSNTAIQAVEPETTEALTLYAYYQKSVEATFHYWNGTAQTNAKASNTRTYISKSGGVTQVDTNLTIPTAVTGSSGKYATVYRGVSKDTNSTTTIATPKTDITTYYAVYTVPVTFYYYNGSSHTSKSETRQWLSNGTTYVNTITAVPTPSSYNSSTFKNWSTKSGEVSSISPNEPKSVDATTLYAYYERTITATFHYWNRGTNSAKSTTNNNIRTYISKSGGVTTLNTDIVIPTTVTSSGGPEATSYVHVAATAKGQTAATPNTAQDNPVYYAVYNKTVTATLKEYNNNVFGTPTGTAWGYYDGTTTNAEITLGTPQNKTIDGNTYRPRWWSETEAPDAPQAVALGGKASILYDKTYYAPYESTIVATFYYWNGTKQTSTTNSALGYMNYKGELMSNEFEIPPVVTSSSGKYSTEYVNISASPNSIVPATVDTTTTAYYAYYIKQITYWYYNGSAQTSSTADRHWLSNGTTYVASVTAEPTPSKYDSADFKGWSKSNAAVQAVEPETTDALTLYAYYQKSVEATFHYWNGTAQTNAKASNTRTYISKSGGVTQLDTNLTIPTAVTGSSGKYATVYRGVSKDTNSTTTIATPKTDITTYYAVYTVPVTFYYYNGSSHTSKAETRKWLSSGSTYVNTMSAVPTPSKYNQATFIDWSTTANTKNCIAPNEPKSVDATKLYAYYEREITATYWYFNNQSVTNSDIRTHISQENSTISTQNPTLTVPTAVSGSAGPEGTAYKFISDTVKGHTAVTPTTTNDNPVYYAIYNKTVTATLKEYNNHVFGTPTGTAWGYYNGTTDNAEITLGTPENKVIDGDTYKPRWWSETEVPDAPQKVALGGKASILYDKTYYVPYEATITARFYYWNGTAQAVATSSAPGFMNYLGEKMANAFTIPNAVKNSSGKYSTVYVNISASPNSVEPAVINTATTAYYAFYVKEITYWYYNGTAQTSLKADRRWLSQGADSTYQAFVTAEPTPSKYDNADVKGWSKSNTAVQVVEPETTDALTLYAYYQRTATSTFYYWNGTARASDTASNTRTYISKSGGVTQLDTALTIPTTVTGSSGKYSTTYKGVSKDINSVTTMSPTTEHGKYYAVYTVPVTFYYWNGTSHTAQTETRRWLSDNSTYNATMSAVPEPSTYQGAVFRGWSKTPDVATLLVDPETPATVNETKLYADSERTIVVKFHYWDGANNVSATDSEVRVHISQPDNGASTINPTLEVPDVVKNSQGPEGTEYKFVSNEEKGKVSVTPDVSEDNPEYYAIYNKTVTATLKEYNNHVFGTPTGTAWGFYDGSTENAQITLGTPQNKVISGDTYTPRWWSESETPDAAQTVALGAKASILYDKTFYVPYQATITAKFYYWNGSIQTVATSSAPGFMNYLGEKMANAFTIPTAVTSSSGKYSTEYENISVSPNSVEPATVNTATTAYYAYYVKEITYWYYNGTAQTSLKADRRWLSQGEDSTYQAFVTDEPTPSKYDNADVKGWSKSNTAVQVVEPETTDALTLYAYYEKTITANFYYWNGTAHTSDTASNTRTYISKSGVVTQLDTPLTIPTTVTGSSGKYSTVYRGISKDTNSVTMMSPTTEITKYYAVYTVPITYYYYNGSSHIGKVVDRQWLSNGTAYVASVTAEPTPSKFDEGTFKDWSTTSDVVTSIAPQNPETVDETTLYAYYERTITATFNYWDRGASSAKTATNSNIRTYISKNAAATTINTEITIPTAVTSSGGPANTAYQYVSKAKTQHVSVIPDTELDNPVYYAIYNKTVTATLMEYNNHVFKTPTGTAWGYYDGDTKNALITLDAPETKVVDGETYIPMWWSTDTAPDAEMSVALGGQADILNDETYYVPYEATIKATFYYWDKAAGAQKSAEANAGGYINYVGDVKATEYTIPAVVLSSSGEYSTEYVNVASSPNSVEPVEVINTEITVYYAFYTVPISYWYYNGTTQVEKQEERYWLSQGVADTYQASVTGKPTPSKYDNANFKGWSTSDTQVIAVEPETTVNTTLYAYYEKTMTGTFYYWNGTAQATDTASNTRTYISKTSVVTQLDTPLTIPASVSGSSGKYATIYRGVSKDKSSTVTISPTTEITTYYAVYTVPITYYWYNGTRNTSTAAERHWLTDQTQYVSTVTQIPEPRPYDGAAFIGWSSSNTEDIDIIPNETDAKNLYAYYKKEVVVTFYYWDGDSQETTTNSNIRTYITKSASTGDVQIIQTNILIPEVVKQNTGPAETNYAHVAYEFDSKDPAVVTTAVTTYYAVYNKTVTATLWVYENRIEAEPTGTAWGFSDVDGTTENAEIPLGTTADVIDDGEVYKPRWWSLDPAPTADQDVPLNGTASILYDETYYAPYEARITAIFYYWDGSRQASVESSAYGYKNYKNEEISSEYVVPQVVTESIGPEQTEYKFVSGEVYGKDSEATIDTETIAYYAIYNKTVTATKHVYKENITTASDIAWGYSDGVTENAEIPLGTTGNATTEDGEVYTPMWWSLETDPDGEKELDLNATASIIYDINYYVPYEKNVTVTYHKNGGTGTVPTSETKIEYMNYKEELLTPEFTFKEGTMTKSKHTLVAWNTTETGSGITYSFGQTEPITKSFTAYAMWMTSTDPEDRDVKQYNEITFSTVGTNVSTYQWYKAESEVAAGVLIEGATSADYTIPAEEVTKHINNTYYYCVVKNNAHPTATYTTDRALLVVWYPPILSDLTEDMRIKQDHTVTFEFNVVEDGNPNIYTYQWYKIPKGQTEPVAIEGATSRTYTTTAALELHATKYYCVVTDNLSKYSTPTNKATLNILATPIVTLTKGSEYGYTYTSGDWTKENVFHNVNSGGVLLSKYQYSTNGTNWVDMTTDFAPTYQKVQNKMTYLVDWHINSNFIIRGMDELGNLTPESELFTLRIDKIIPTVEQIVATPSSASTYTLTISGLGDETDTTDQSGLRGYFVNTTGETPTINSSWKETTESTVQYTNAAEQTTYFAWTIDNAGNISERISIKTKIIYYTLNDTSWYECFADAVAAATSGNTMKPVKYVVDDTSSGIVDKNLIFNTNGKTVEKIGAIVVKPGVTFDVKGTGTIVGKESEAGVIEPTIYSEGSLKITAGTIKNEGTTTLVARNSGNIDLAGGRVDQHEDAKAAVALEGTGTITQRGTTVNGNVYSGAGTLSLTSGTINGNVHGGKINAVTTTPTNIVLDGTTITGGIYGGGHETPKVNEVNITLTSGRVAEVHGGGLNSPVGTVNIVYNGGTITNSTIYGGPKSAGTVENANIDIKASLDNVYGGGNQGGITTNSNITLHNTANIANNVYGGGDKAPIGSATNSGTATINVLGGTIQGNLYGGSNGDVVYGNINVNIGKHAAGNGEYTATSLIINGNIYGGGRREDLTDYTEASVIGTTNVNIDANGYTTFKTDQNIFGSGEYCTSDTSNITIKNLQNAYLISSIQRASTVTIDNSNLEIQGVTDLTNANTEIAFTFNRIGNLRLKNGATLHLRRGFNQVEGFTSLVDVGGTETKASVKIENGEIKESNTINRVYVYEGINLIIAKEQYTPNAAISTYGKVNGMTFFGMYARDYEEETFKYDLYSPTSPTNGKMFALASYAQGLYDATGAITVDGFFTNVAVNEEDANSRIIPEYINVTTYAPRYQDWIIGLKTYTKEVTMIAKRDRDRVYETVELDNLIQAGAKYDMKLFTGNSLEEGVTIIDRSQVPTLAETSEKANTTFGLTLQNSASGWITQGETLFYSTGSTPVKGTMQYISDDSGNAPSFDLVLYNSINIDKNSDCGLVSIVFLVTEITEGDAVGGMFRLAITVNIQTLKDVEQLEFQTESYITSGKNYGIFITDETHITERSSMTATFVTYPIGIYNSSDYRVLISGCQIPENTKITMIDTAQGTGTKVYYYETTDEYDAIEGDNYIYKLSRFTLMGAVGGNKYYSNPNSAYQAEGYEEYRFIFDFENAEIDSNLLRKTLSLELRNSAGVSRNIQLSTIKFNIYKDVNSELTLQVNKDANNVYDIIEEGTLKFTAISNIQKETVDGTPINDTYYDEKKLGMSISLRDSEGNALSPSQTMGMYIKINGQEYTPDSTGKIRLYLSDVVANVSKNIEFHIASTVLESGEYKIRIENFVSYSGTFYGLTAENKYDIDIKIVDLNHGLKVEIEDDDRLIDAPTGINYGGIDSIMNIDIKASDVVQDTNIRMTLYRRDLTFNDDLTYADISYTEVDLEDYIDTAITSLIKPEDEGLVSSSTNEYLITDEVQEQTLIELALKLKENLPTGGYKLAFNLYSGDNLLGGVDRHFVITDLVNVETPVE